MQKKQFKWRRLGRRVAKLKDGESIVLHCKSRETIYDEARAIRGGLNGINACLYTRRSVRVEYSHANKAPTGRIIIKRVGTWPGLLFTPINEHGIVTVTYHRNKPL